MQTQALFFNKKNWGGGFRNALIVENICKGKQEITFLISGVSSAYPEILGLIFIHEQPGNKLPKEKRREMMLQLLLVHLIFFHVL